MAVTGIGNNYNVYESAYAPQKNEAVKKPDAKKPDAKETAAVQAESTKKSAGGKGADYYSYLSKNYDCVKNGNVAISGSYLRQCANDPEKAKELEENLSLYNELRDRGYESAKQNAQKLGGRLVSYSESWSIDSKGEITMISSTTVVTENGTKDRKEVREEQEERLKEKKEKAKRAEKVKEQKEEKQEQLEKLQKSKPEDVYYPKFDAGV
ncbi:MAG: hypothetical protein J1E35_08515 [Lachnospiraceae bacterium]|nr:hypothetical protein [Lachnospiraceae bacterium]